MMIDFKKQCLASAGQLVQDKIVAYQNDLQQLNADKASDTKSSAGDKYETGRAMIQQELDKIEARLLEQRQFLAQITQLIQQQNPHQQVSNGTLIKTNKGYFLFSCPLGQIKVGDKNVFFASIASPLGQAARQKKVADDFLVNSNSFQILELA
ncbi:MAG: hypothetical protein LAT68_05135 [Cyclobacteriaceae bacterium]|nr:hypothetical protein [Cyclobacteriaceae bacterium]MCH8515694.1 hypothetical protein [Cyclobacteriaceae bacterium]